MPVAQVTGPNHRIRYVNPASCLLTGETKETLIGSDFCDVPQAGKHCVDLLCRVYKTGQSMTHTGQDRSEFHPLFWSYVMWPLLSREKRTLGIVIQVTETTAFHQDTVAINQALLLGSLRQHELVEEAELLTSQLRAEIASRKNAQQALITSEKLASVGRMASVLAHEINNPLAAVMDIVYLVKSRTDLPDEIREYIENADGELKRIAQITRQTLSLTRGPAVASEFPLLSMMESVVEMLKAKIIANAAVVQIRCDAALQVSGIHGELRQVLSNFLLNSLHATGEHGRMVLRGAVSISPTDGSRRIRLSIADNGHGISHLHLSQIFEPFFTTKGMTGNGLGLWISMQIIGKHGGTVRVRSAMHGLHQGTTISVVLPTGSAN